MQLIVFTSPRDRSRLSSGLAYCSVVWIGTALSEKIALQEAGFIHTARNMTISVNNSIAIHEDDIPSHDGEDVIVATSEQFTIWINTSPDMFMDMTDPASLVEELATLSGQAEAI